MDVVELRNGAGNVSIAGFANIEGLVLNDAVAGSIAGTTGDDFLGSKGGAHTLQGDAGNDTYSVHQGDLISGRTPPAARTWSSPIWATARPGPSGPVLKT